MKIDLIVFSLLALMLAGCSEKDDGQVEYLIRSENRMLTAAGADKLLDVQLAMTADGRAKKRLYVESLESKFKLDVVVQDYADLKRIMVDEKAVSRVQQKLLKRNPNFDKGHLRTLKRLIHEELLAKAVRKSFEESCVVRVPEREVVRRAELIAKISESGSRSNVCQRVRATNCWERIRSGALTFEDACREFDETKNPNEGGVWGEYALDAFGDEETELKSRLPAMNVGDVTPPLPGDNGLVIVKLLGTGTSSENKGVAVPAKTYRLARIFFHLYETWPAPSLDELREDLKRIELNDRWSAFVSHLLSKTSFSYGRDGQALKDWKTSKLKEVKK